MNKLDFMKKFRPDELCIKEFENWIIVLRRKQTTLGDAVILLKREVPTLFRQILLYSQLITLKQSIDWDSNSIALIL